MFLDVLRELGDRLEGIEDVTPEGVLAHIERTRVNSGMNQDDLADIAEVSRPHYSEMLRRPTLNPKLRTMLRLAAAADCELTVRPCDPAPAHSSVAAGAESPKGAPGRSPSPSSSPPSPSSEAPAWAPWQTQQGAITTQPPVDVQEDARHNGDPSAEEDEHDGSFLHYKPRRRGADWDDIDHWDDWMKSTNTAAEPSPVSPVPEAFSWAAAPPTKSPLFTGPPPVTAAAAPTRPSTSPPVTATAAPPRPSSTPPVTAPTRPSSASHEVPCSVQPQVHMVRTIQVGDRRPVIEIDLIPGARESVCHEILEVRVPGCCLSVHTGTFRLRTVAGQHTLYYEDHMGPRLGLNLPVDAIPECSFKYVQQPPVW